MVRQELPGRPSGEARAAVEHEILGQLAGMPREHRAWNADDLEGEAALGGDRIGRDLARNVGESRHHGVASRLREQALPEPGRQIRGHLQLAQCGAVQLAVRGADRAAERLEIPGVQPLL
jgi:hypothetical protein